MIITNKYILDIHIFNSWDIDCDPGFHGFFFQNNNHQAVKKMEYIYIYITW